MTKIIYSFCECEHLIQPLSSQHEHTATPPPTTAQSTMIILSLLLLHYIYVYATHKQTNDTPL